MGFGFRGLVCVDLGFKVLELGGCIAKHECDL